MLFKPLGFTPCTLRLHVFGSMTPQALETNVYSKECYDTKNQILLVVKVYGKRSARKQSTCERRPDTPNMTLGAKQENGSGKKGNFEK